MTSNLNYSSFPLIAGSDNTLTVGVVDNDDAIVSLVGGTVRFVLYTPNDKTIVLDSDSSPVGATITITNDVGGILVVSLDNKDTAALLGDYVYEIKVTISGLEQVTNRGVITFEANVT